MKKVFLIGILCALLAACNNSGSGGSTNDTMPSVSPGGRDTLGDTSNHMMDTGSARRGDTMGRM